MFIKLTLVLGVSTWLRSIYLNSMIKIFRKKWECGTMRNYWWFYPKAYFVSIKC